ncbi:MAG: glutathione peroxidase [Kofleriaceae bacterium]|nr:glutathione peroxidase [Kofleriaceae bacterium]
MRILPLLTLVSVLSCSKTSSKEAPVEPAEPEAATVEVEQVTGTKVVAEQPLEAPVTYDLSEQQAALIFDSPLQTLGGAETSLATLRGKQLLVVNVASACGLTPQYEMLQSIHEKYQARGFSVVGFPCNQFGGQEPGTPEEILAFGKEQFGVTFPLMQKVDTNGDKRHPIYQSLTQVKDAQGKAGDVMWNFEKFLLSADGKEVTRFRPTILPDDPQLILILEAGLPN